MEELSHEHRINHDEVGREVGLERQLMREDAATKGQIYVFKLEPCHTLSDRWRTHPIRLVKSPKNQLTRNGSAIASLCRCAQGTTLFASATKFTFLTRIALITLTPTCCDDSRALEAPERITKPGSRRTRTKSTAAPVLPNSSQVTEATFWIGSFTPNRASADS